MPSAPVAVALSAQQRAVSANAELTRTYSPQNIYIQLAVLGAPTLATPVPNEGSFLVKPGIEDAPMPMLTPLGTVRSTDLATVVAILEAHGIRRADVTTNLPHATNGPIGELRVAVQPATRSQFNSIASKVGAAIAEYHNIVGTGTIVQLSNCDAQTETVNAALDKAAAVASILANSAHLSPGALLRNNLHPNVGSSQYQTICGSQEAASPVYDWGAPMSGSLGDYPVSIEGGVVFQAQPVKTSPVPNQHFIESADDSAYDSTVVSHQFIIPDSEPFVSAQGQFRAVVTTDTTVAEFVIAEVPSRPIPAHLLEAIVSAIRSTGLSNGAMMRDAQNIFVRLTSDDQFARLQGRVSTIVNKYGGYPLYTSTIPFLARCESVRNAVAGQAYHEALIRAKIMAGEARLKVGAVIAVSDAGFHDGAICGYGKSSSLKTLVDAIKKSPDDVVKLGPEPTFSSNIVVAWRLEGVDAAPRSASLSQPEPPYAYSTVNQAFTTRGEGVLGETKRMLRPTQAFLSLPLQQHTSPLLPRYFKDEWWEQSGNGIERAGELRGFGPERVKAVLAELRKSGVTPNGLQFRSAACEQVQAQALREATRLALSRAGSHPLQALIDQNPIYRPNFSICGLRRDLGSAGTYLGGSYTDYDTAEYSITERVLAVTGK